MKTLLGILILSICSISLFAEKMFDNIDQTTICETVLSKDETSLFGCRLDKDSFQGMATLYTVSFYDGNKTVFKFTMLSRDEAYEIASKYKIATIPIYNAKGQTDKQLKTVKEDIHKLVHSVYKTHLDKIEYIVEVDEEILSVHFIIGKDSDR